jgi:hypothetical protein
MKSLLLVVRVLGVAQAQSTRCYTIESLRGSWVVANSYGANVALGLQTETLV